MLFVFKLILTSILQSNTNAKMSFNSLNTFKEGHLSFVILLAIIAFVKVFLLIKISALINYYR